MKYKGYIIRPCGFNFAITMASGKVLFADAAANIKTAKKWIDAYLIEREAIKREGLRIQGVIDFNG